jgi:hypothetical protein
MRRILRRLGGECLMFLLRLGIAFCTDHGKDTAKADVGSNVPVKQPSAAACPPAAKASANHIEH